MMQILALIFFISIFSTLAIKPPRPPRPSLPQLTGLWKGKDGEYVNYDNSNTWYEMFNEKVFAQFNFSKVVDDKDVILQDYYNRFYMRITFNKIYYGTFIDSILSEESSGKWIVMPEVMLIKCTITLNTLKENDVFNHRLVIVRGKIECPLKPNEYFDSMNSDGRFIKINNANIKNYHLRNDNKWPVSTLDEFTLLVRLANGTNNLEFTYEYLNERASLSLSIKHEVIETEPLHLAILLTKDSPELFDMDPRSKLVEKNDLFSAIDRFRTIAKMWQAFTSESLNRYGLGYKSFHLVEGSDGEVVVNLMKSNITLNELWSTENDRISLVFDTLKKDPLYEKKTKDSNLHVACLILDSHWDPIQMKLLGETVFAEKRNDIQLGIFGSHLTHSWPENNKELVWRLTDNNNIDKNAVANDASPTKFKAFNIGAGGFLHIVGHLLGLLQGEALMGTGFFTFNRAFISIEPKDDTFIAIGHDVDDLDAIWSEQDANQLAVYSIFNAKESSRLLNNFNLGYSVYY